MAAVARRRTRGHDEAGHANHERWLLTYADMITLLMVFFIVLFSMSSADAQKFKQLQTSLREAFRVDVLKGDDPTALNGNDGSAPSPALVEAIAQAGLNPDTRMVSAIEDIHRTLARLPQPTPGMGHVEIGANRDGVVISLAGNFLFESGKADLKPHGLMIVDGLAARLREMPNEIRIEGHTDAVPIATALYPSNWELSSARATTLGRYLVEAGKVAPQRVAAAGYGEHRPIAPNDSREGRSRNRRVDVVVLFTPMPSSTLAGSAPAGTVLAAVQPTDRPTDGGGRQ